MSARTATCTTRHSITSAVSPRPPSSATARPPTSALTSTSRIATRRRPRTTACKRPKPSSTRSSRTSSNALEVVPEELDHERNQLGARGCHRGPMGGPGNDLDMRAPAGQLAQLGGGLGRARIRVHGHGGRRIDEHCARADGRPDRAHAARCNVLAAAQPVDRRVYVLRQLVPIGVAEGAEGELAPARTARGRAVAAHVNGQQRVVVIGAQGRDEGRPLGARPAQLMDQHDGGRILALLRRVVAGGNGHAIIGLEGHVLPTGEVLRGGSLEEQRDREQHALASYLSFCYRARAWSTTSSIWRLVSCVPTAPVLASSDPTAAAASAGAPVPRPRPKERPSRRAPTCMATMTRATRRAERPPER